MSSTPSEMDFPIMIRSRLEGPTISLPASVDSKSRTRPMWYRSIFQETSDATTRLMMITSAKWHFSGPRCWMRALVNDSWTILLAVSARQLKDFCVKELLKILLWYIQTLATCCVRLWTSWTNPQREVTTKPKTQSTSIVTICNWQSYLQTNHISVYSMHGGVELDRMLEYNS